MLDQLPDGWGDAAIALLAVELSAPLLLAAAVEVAVEGVCGIISEGPGLVLSHGNGVVELLLVDVPQLVNHAEN